MKCPICEKTFRIDDTPAPPFCSERCKRIDLGHWLDEDYGLPYEVDDGPQDDPPPTTAED